MDLTNFWYSSGAAGGGGGGVDIGQSLRFRGDQILQRTSTTNGNRRTWTWAGWVKKAYTGIDGTTLFRNDNGTQSEAFRTDSSDRYEWSTLNAGYFRFPGVFRDPAAWYHIVIAFDSTQATAANRIRGFVNGVEQTWASYTAPAQNAEVATGGTGTYVIGGSHRTTTLRFEGYLADVIFIEGQALEPTAFGRENANGVWVPREVDFTPAGMRLSDFFTPTNPNPSGGTPESAFDGNLRTNATTNTNGTWTFAPDPGIAFTRLRCTTNNTAGLSSYTFDGTTVNSGGQDVWVEVATNGTINATTPLVVNGTSSSRAELSAIEITDADGTRILTNPFIWSADLFTNGPSATYPVNATGRDFNLNGVTNTADKAFDGNEGTECETDYTWVDGIVNGTVESSWLVWRPSTNIAANTSVRVRTRRCQTIIVNGVDTGFDQTSTSRAWVDISSALTFPITINNLGIEGNSFNGLLSAVEIDGQVITDGVNNSYGANGFRLQFADPDDLGHDSSGNGNDFTPSSDFNTNPVGIFTEQLFTSTKSSIDFSSTNTDSNSTTYAFDNNTSLATQTNATTNSSLIFRPTVPFTGVTQIRVYNDTSGMENGYNSANTVSAPGGWSTVYSGPAITVNNIFTQSDNRSKINAIEINGTVLVNNTGNDYDLMQDSPTQNYATLNPFVGIDGTAILQNANLKVKGNSVASPWSNSRSTQAVNNGKWYFEYQLLGSEGQVGISTVANTLTNLNDPQVRDGGLFWFIDGDVYLEGTVVSTIATYNNTNVLGVAFDLDSNPKQVRWFKDGTSAGTTNLPSDWNDQSIYAMANARSSNEAVVNFGQQPFVYTPPTGFERLQTQNLPAATIANGRDHFRAIIWDGDDTSPRTLPVGFEPDLVWIKSRPNATSHMLWDRVRGWGASKEILADSNRAEGNATTNTAGAGFVSGTTADGFTVEAGTLNDAYVNDGVRDYVAFCWKAGGAAVANNDGSTASSISVNDAAGFSIVTYTGTGNNATVGHGLSAPPEFVLYKVRTDTNGWGCYALPMGNEAYLQLNQPNSATTGVSNIFNSQNPTASVLHVGTNAITNTKDKNYVAYCWRPIPGYSAFGSYTGNGDPEGPFVALSFRPALVIIKSSTSGTSWIMRDSTRDIDNPARAYLFPNLNNAEAAGHDIDFLSNGFKPRSGINLQNNDGSTYIYAAFAENPFQSPVTAR